MVSSAPHVLVVDDDQSVRGVVSTVLQLEGFRVTVAPDGVDALDQLEDGDFPDAIVLDLMMPDVTGWEVLEELRGDNRPRFRVVPVLVLTAKATEWDRDRTLNGGADLHMAKPFEPDELVDAIRDLIRKAAERGY